MRVMSANKSKSSSKQNKKSPNVLQGNGGLGWCGRENNEGESGKKVVNERVSGSGDNDREWRGGGGRLRKVKFGLWKWIKVGTKETVEGVQKETIDRRRGMCAVRMCDRKWQNKPKTTRRRAKGQEQCCWGCDNGDGASDNWRWTISTYYEWSATTANYIMIVIESVNVGESGTIKSNGAAKQFVRFFGAAHDRNLWIDKKRFSVFFRLVDRRKEVH
jgi:hypothetical protein